MRGELQPPGVGGCPSAGEEGDKDICPFLAGPSKNYEEGRRPKAELRQNY